jgi:hypothetical protein
VGTYLDGNANSITLFEIGINLFKVSPLPLSIIHILDPFKKDSQNSFVFLGARNSAKDSESGIKIMIPHPASSP